MSMGENYNSKRFYVAVVYITLLNMIMTESLLKKYQPGGTGIL